ncbi:MAG: isochorismatase family protein [Glaciimonas sp.]|nr:isochorismatase family protein [Glaciimonas sp.]
MPAIDDGDAVLRNATILAQAAQLLAIPALATEQYPVGLGHTAPEIAALCPESVEKTTFGACGTPAFLEALHRLAPSGAPTLLISGCEAHICVLQTALQLQAQGYDVRVVVDAVGSRSAISKHTALERMRAASIGLVTTEMVLFEWLRDSKHMQFRGLSKLIK